MFKIVQCISRGLMGISFVLMLFGQGSMAMAQDSSASVQDVFMSLPNQKYALCAGALSFNFDGITYAKCQKLKGNSVSVPHAYPPSQNIQTVNRIGTTKNTYRVSTFSPPKPSSYALYTCAKSGAYAQCDGGLCFENTSGKPFPGVGKVKRNEIICSCPIVTTDPVYHVWGPATCPKTSSEYDAICGAGEAKEQSADGNILRIGAVGPAEENDLLTGYYNIEFGTSYVTKKCPRPEE
jgi:hypothetical protein